MNEIIFRDELHMEMYDELIKRCRRVNNETVPVMYLLALACDSINKAESLFDFKTECIKPDEIHQGWQTSGSIKATRLAFVLWNGFPTEDEQKLNNVYNIFGSGWDEYFIEAIKLRFNIE